jgi:hypothetical protein
MEELIIEPPPTPPQHYAGKWIAYNADRTKIIASGENLEAARNAASETDEQNPIFCKVPRGFRVAGLECA